MNTCRTCSTFTANGGKCVGLTHFPNASIAEYGSVQGEVCTPPPIA
jgi:cathepsin X